MCAKVIVLLVIYQVIFGSVIFISNVIDRIKICYTSIYCYFRNMKYINLCIACTSAEQADLISALLIPTAYVGTEYNEEYLSVYFQDYAPSEAIIDELLSPLKLSYRIETIPAQNWNQSWESNFEPIIINDNVGIRADFHPPRPDLTFDLIITPKMSFGTGHHETTHMMMEFISDIDCENKRVFDFGTGTGVLAIFAKRKKAAYCIANDNDPWCFENAVENCKRNLTEDIVVTLDPIQNIQDEFDIIIANINLNILVDNVKHLSRLSKSGADLFLSGILICDIPQIKRVFIENKFEYIEHKTKNNWAAIHLKKVNI